MCCTVKYTASNLGDQAQDTPKLMFYYIVTSSATCNNFNTKKVGKRRGYDLERPCQTRIIIFTISMVNDEDKNVHLRSIST